MTQIISFLNWTVVGLVYDIVGAIFLAAAVFFNSPGKIAHQAGTYWNSSPYAVRAFAEQTMDTRIGLMLLVIGFALQIVGQCTNTSDGWVFVSLLMIILVIVAAYTFFARKWFVDRLISRVDEYQNREVAR